MTFEDLVVGPFNKIAVQASEMVAENPGKHYPLLIIQGKLGSGKTTLLNAIESKADKKNVIKHTAESLMYALVDSIKTNQTFLFKEALKNCEILIIDDLYNLKNKIATQELLWTVSKYREEHSKQTIITTNKSLYSDEGISKKLRIHLLGGLHVDIEYPNFEERSLLVKNISKRLNLSIYEDVCCLIAENFKSNITEIYGSLLKLKFYSESDSIDLNLESAGKILKTHRPMVIGLDNVLNNIDYNKTGHKLPLILGQRSNGELYVEDLSSTCNLLLTGRTGSGKSSLLHSFVKSLRKASTVEFQLILIDMMKLEFNEFRNDEEISYISSEPDVMKTIDLIKEQMSERNKTFEKLNVKSINEYELLPGHKNTMSRIVVMIDGLEHLQLTENGKEIESSICYIACRASTFGVHIIASTQMPQKDVVTRAILSSFENRICLPVTHARESKWILNQKGAEKLIERGEMLYKKDHHVEGLRGLKIS